MESSSLGWLESIAAELPFRLCESVRKQNGSQQRKSQKAAKGKDLKRKSIEKNRGTNRERQRAASETVESKGGTVPLKRTRKANESDCLVIVSMTVY
jgi:hypothetical protein